MPQFNTLWCFFCSMLPLLFRALPQAEGVLAAMPGMTVALYIDLFARL